jgi:hypothetical protein
MVNISLVITSLLFLILAAEVATAQVPSEMKRMGLNGPVRTIRERYQVYSPGDTRWDPGDPMYKVERFDRNGNCLTFHLDPGSGWQAHGLPLSPATAAPLQRYEIVKKSFSGSKWMTVWKFDEKGRLGRFECHSVGNDGPSLGNWQEYSYDSEGRVTEMTYWANWGRRPGQTEPHPPKRVKYWFDHAGRIGGFTEMDYDARFTLTYDNQGRVVKLVMETDDSLSTRTWLAYDQHGNWTLQGTSEARVSDGRVDTWQRSIISREITYWPDSKKRSRPTRK